MSTPVIFVRDFNEQDIVAMDLYFDNASDEYLYGLGVEASLIRGQPSDFERIRRNLAMPVKDRPSHSYAVEIDGELAGLAVIKGIKFGDAAEMHAHTFELKNRQRGFGSSIFFEILKRAFETFELKVLVCEPTSTNAAPNALLQKAGLKIVSSYDVPAGGILRARRANRYEITREFVFARGVLNYFT